MAPSLVRGGGQGPRPRGSAVGSSAVPRERNGGPHRPDVTGNSEPYSPSEPAAWTLSSTAGTELLPFFAV